MRKLFTTPANSIIDSMWEFLKDGGQKGNPASLQSYVYQLIKMMTQKTAGQKERGSSNADWNELDLVIQAIVIEAICLVLDKNYKSTFLEMQRIVKKETEDEKRGGLNE